jgi:hypothetical protein
VSVCPVWGLIVKLLLWKLSDPQVILQIWDALWMVNGTVFFNRSMLKKYMLKTYKRISVPNGIA